MTASPGEYAAPWRWRDMPRHSHSENGYRYRHDHHGYGSEPELEAHMVVRHRKVIAGDANREAER